MPAAKLNPTQLAVLQFLVEGKSAYTYCRNRSEHGARTCTVIALRRRGYVKGFETTAEGKAAFERAQASRVPA